MARSSTPLRVFPALLLACFACNAHTLAGIASQAGAFTRWTWDPWVLALLLASGTLYAAGLSRLLGKSRGGRTALLRGAGLFAAGWISLVAAFISPIDALGGELFSAHMLQHEILMLISAPLLVLGRPIGMWTWAFPRSTRKRLSHLLHYPFLKKAWNWLTAPLNAWALHASSLWAWHVPALFEAALERPRIHALQHTSFFLSALVFWWSIFGTSGMGNRMGKGMLSLFTTMAHTTALGALLTLAPGIWYPVYVARAEALGVDALVDQQLGGLIMWVPGGLAYFFSALAVAAEWLAHRPSRGTSFHPPS